MNSQGVTQIETEPYELAKIKVVGVGGGGCNAIEQMIASNTGDIEFTCINTDAQALAKYNPGKVIQLGGDLTRGLGAGADPEIGRQSAEESREEIAKAIDNADMLFLTAGMGGGTGTGAVPVVAKIARELGILTVAVVTKPFGFEGEKRKHVAEAGLKELRAHVDSMIVVPNENLLTFLGPDISLLDAFSAANDIVTSAVQSIVELITNTGLINVDFADVKSVMSEMGYAIMSTGRGIGDNRAEDAAISAIESPLLENVDLKEARGILANITASSDLSMGEFQVVGDVLRRITADDANVVIGTVFDQSMKDEMRVTVVATGLHAPVEEDAKKNTKRVANTAKQKAQQTQATSTAARTTKTTARSGAAKTAAAATAQPASNAPAVTNAVTQTDVCIICGSPSGSHKEKCPWAGKTAEPVTVDNQVPKVAAEQPPKVPKAPKAPKVRTAKKLSSGQKYSLAGLAIGVLALGSIFYVAMNNGKIATSYDALVNKDQQSLPVPAAAMDGEAVLDKFSKEKNNSDLRQYLPHKIPDAPTEPVRTY